MRPLLADMEALAELIVHMQRPGYVVLTKDLELLKRGVVYIREYYRLLEAH